MPAILLENNGKNMKVWEFQTQEKNQGRDTLSVYHNSFYTNEITKSTHSHYLKISW